MSETTGLFDKLYSAGKAVYDEIKKPVIKNKIARKLAAAYDDATLKIGEAELKMQKNREDFEKYDVNVILEQQGIIDTALGLQERIKVEYKTLFGKEMVIEKV